MEIFHVNEYTVYSDSVRAVGAQFIFIFWIHSYFTYVLTDSNPKKLRNNNRKRGSR